MQKEIYNTAVHAAIKAGERILEIYNGADFEVSYKNDNSPLTKADRAAHEIIVKFLYESPYPILSEEGKDIPFEERSQWKTFWLVDPLDGTKEFIKKNGEFTVNIALIIDGKPVFGVVYAPVLDELYVGIVGKGAWLWKNPEVVNINTLTENGISLPLEKRNQVYKIVASRSHLNSDTEEYLNKLRSEKGEIEIVSKGSSLKLCLVATGQADEYPRLGPTMEWDVAAAHSIVKACGKHVFKFESLDKEFREELDYNKENLLNPYFIAH